MLNRTGRAAVPTTAFCLFFVMMLACGALAQTAPARMEGEKDCQLATMVVTAQKRKENLQHVPASVSVLSVDDIEDGRITEMADIHSRIPNFFTFGSNRGVGAAMFNMRGLGNFFEGDSPVSIYVDDIPITESKSFAFALDNVERIEVLRGPQGTLYGMNTEAGAINIVTRQPGNELEGMAGLEYGSFDRYRARVAVSGPVVRDRLLAGLSVLAEGTDGYLKNRLTGHDLGGWHSTMGSLRLHWKASDRLDVRLSVSAEDTDDGDWTWVVRDRQAYDAAWNAGLNRHDVYINNEGLAKTESDMESLKISYRLPWFNLESISSRHYRSRDLDGDFDCTPADYLSMTQEGEDDHYTQEIRLVSPEHKERLSWIAGAFYARRSGDHKTVNEFGRTAPVSFDSAMEADSEGDTYAAFGQSTLRLLGGKLGITAGLRYEHAERTIDRQRYLAMDGRRFNIDDPALGRLAAAHSGNYRQKRRFDTLLPKFALDYRLSPAMTLYASVARGYKPGGFSTTADNPELAGFDPEYAWTYEAGLKSRLLNDRMRLNLTAFYTAVRDYQDRMRVNLNEIAMKNAAKAKIYGAEAELRLRPLTGLDITASLGWTHAEYKDYTDHDKAGNPVRFDGNSIAMTPEYQYHLALQYRFVCGLYLRGEVAGVGTFYFTRENVDRLRQGSYETVNLKLGYETERFDLYLFGDNIFDEYYFTQLKDTARFRIPGVTEAGCVGEPATFGVMATFRL